jgi:lysophospholipase L1-like esterase
MRGARLSITLVALVACGDDAAQSSGSSDTTGADTTGSESPTSSPTAASTTMSASDSVSASAGSTSGPDETSTGTTSDPDTTGTSSDDGNDTGETGIFEMCFSDDFVNGQTLGPNYDQFNPTIGSHCLGTNHQDIGGIERVVFVGDSITVGTPPTFSADYYRSKLADALMAAFGLEFGTGGESGDLWKLVNVFDGTSIAHFSGDFASCAKWGARNDDLLQDNSQLEECFPAETRELVNLVVMTSGGNDLSSLTQAAIDGATEEMLWAQIEDAVQLEREAVEWLKDSERFPNGTHVIIANLYEFTDGTGEVMSCDVSGLAGFDEPIPAPDQLAEMVIWANEQYMAIATETGADMIFLLESFCGHGFNADDPTAPCYRGPGAETWFDLTCIHPNPTGHQQIADMFLAVVGE